MAKKMKRSQSEIDGVQYRRAKTWQIILVACNALVGMSVYNLIGMASYSASVGYGITTAVVGIILTCTRILDGITDPLVAFLYDKVNTKFGKLRVLLISGFVIEAVALLAMFDFMSSKGFGWIVFTLLYVVYVIGYTITNMTAQTFGAIMTNDPKQRPIIGVWSTAFNYLVPMILSIVMSMVLLPMYGNEYNQGFLTAAVRVSIVVGALGILLVSIGISAYDKPQYYEGVGKQEPLKIRDMANVLVGNKPLQCYIAAQASDKIAQQTVSQAVITTMLFGILIGDMGLGTMLSVIGMAPSIIFAVIGAKYAGRYGSKNAIVTWTKICMGVAVLMFVFFVVIDPSTISTLGPTMILYVIFTLALNGSKMCVTTAASSFMADIIDYELDRSGKYVPAVVTGTGSLIDKLISSFSALIATGAVALIGYTQTVPQPEDTPTPAIFWMTMGIYFGLPLLGWVVTLVAMRYCTLDKEEMVKVQKRIAEKKAAAS
ncbi:MAG: sugar transporter [Lachnospiraceae bacterium]|nr:sugar transporter [Lachnospiraceae bacterium]